MDCWQRRRNGCLVDWAGKLSTILPGVIARYWSAVVAGRIVAEGTEEYVDDSLRDV